MPQASGVEVPELGGGGIPPAHLAELSSLPGLVGQVEGDVACASLFYNPVHRQGSLHDIRVGRNVANTIAEPTWQQ